MKKKKEQINWRNNPIIKKDLLREDVKNIYPVGISDSEFVNIIRDYFLGKGWYTVDCLSHDQINTVVLDSILGTFSKTYIKEMRQYNKERNSVYDGIVISCGEAAAKSIIRDLMANEVKEPKEEK